MRPPECKVYVRPRHVTRGGCHSDSRKAASSSASPGSQSIVRDQVPSPCPSPGGRGELSTVRRQDSSVRTAPRATVAAASALGIRGFVFTTAAAFDEQLLALGL